MRFCGLAALAAMLLMGASLANAAYQRPQNGDCVQGAAGTEALFPSQYMLVGDSATQEQGYTEIISRGFSVQYFNNYKVVTNSVVNETYVLIQCGSAAPEFTAFPEGAKFFNVPLTSISTPETPPYSFLDYLGLGDRVHDVSTFVVNPCGQKLLEQCTGRASPDFMAMSNVTALETTVGDSIDGMVVTTPNPYGKAFTLSAAQDTGGVLERAEWVKFLALFFNMEREASDVFDALKAEYDAAKAAAGQTTAGDTPVLAWAQHFKYDDGTSVTENYQLSFDQYQAQYTEDAGAAMLDREAAKAVKGVTADPFAPDSPTLVYAWGQPGSFATKAEAKAAFLEALKKADVIIDETYEAMDPIAYDITKNWELTAQEAAALPAIAAQKVFRQDGLLSFSDATGYGLDWFESAISRPGLVLKDVVRAVQPEAAEPNQGFTWIRNLSTEKPVVLDSTACTSDAPCVAEPATICPFVQLCGAGQAPAILQSTTAGQCSYAACAAAPAAATPAPPNAAAAMAAPAIVLTLMVVAFVEMLMHFC